MSHTPKPKTKQPLIPDHERYVAHVDDKRSHFVFPLDTVEALPFPPHRRRTDPRGAKKASAT